MGSAHATNIDAALEATSAGGDGVSALGQLVGLVQQHPGRLRLYSAIAGLFERLERTSVAVLIYEALAQAALTRDRPLDAIAAARFLDKLKQPTEDLLKTLASRYAADSKALTPGHRPTGADEVESEAPLVDHSGADLDALAELALTACQRGSEIEGDQFLAPIPLLSDLTPTDFIHAIGLLEVQVHAPNSSLITQGEALPGMWWVVHGKIALNQSETTAAERSLIGLEVLFGENARVTVSCLNHGLTVFLPSAHIGALMQGRNDLRESVRRVVARYEVHRAVAQCDLMRHVPLDDHVPLLARFQGFRVPTGEILVKQGHHSPGLFLITHGQVQLRVENGASDKIVADLRPGDFVGLLGLAEDELATTTAVAASSTRVLFIDATALRDAFTAHPKLKNLLNRVHSDRTASIRAAL